MRLLTDERKKIRFAAANPGTQSLCIHMEKWVGHRTQEIIKNLLQRNGCVPYLKSLPSIVDILFENQMGLW